MNERQYSNACDGDPMSLMDSCQLEKLHQRYDIIFVQSLEMIERDTGSSGRWRRCFLYRLPCKGTSDCAIHGCDVHLTPAQAIQNEAQMKDESKDLIEDMSDILTCALETRKYAKQSQLEKTIKDLENLAKEVRGFVEAYNNTGHSSTLFVITTLMITG